MIGRAPSPSGSLTIDLASELKNERFRHSYLLRHLKVFLAAQIRALRGDMSQAEFGRLIDMPQSVVSRLENQSYGKVTVQTLLKIAIKLDIALIVRFVGFQTFLDWTKDHSPKALAPESYTKESERLAAEVAAQQAFEATRPIAVPVPLLSSQTPSVQLSPAEPGFLNIGQVHIPQRWMRALLAVYQEDPHSFHGFEIGHVLLDRDAASDRTFFGHAGELPAIMAALEHVKQ